MIRSLIERLVTSRRLWSRQPSTRVVVCLVAVLSAACRRTPPAKGETKAEPSAQADSSPAVTMTAAQVQHGGVRWERPSEREAASMIEAPGQLVPNDDRTAHIGAPLQARVMTVHVQAGAQVGRGQVLVTLQSPEASAMRAELSKAVADLSARKAAVAYARLARERFERLLAAKAGSRQELERAQQDEAFAQSELARAEAEVARSRSALSLIGVDAVTGAVVVRSPLAGVVLTRDATPGAVVALPGRRWSR